jgi:tetratricopeptide (TPR) repeat protein
VPWRRPDLRLHVARPALNAMEPYDFDLGTYTRGTSTASASAQTWFDRGLVWSYAFHHEEAIRCFERAVEHDAGFSLAHWGIAYAIGPNYNKQWEAFEPTELAASLDKACAEVAAARAHTDRATPVEQALVEALASRYQATDPSADLEAWNADYAEAMRAVHRAHPDDLDVAALLADALMNLTPWELWDRGTGEPSEGAQTLEAKEVLERALDLPGGRTHPGLLHLYVHLMEMSPVPEQALPVADGLRSLVPDAGHLVHMPTHIDVLCGDYKSTLESNLRAIEVNEKYVAREGRVGFYALYHAHDRHFAIYAALFLGQSEVALRVAADLEASLSEELLRIEQPPMADYLEAFVPMRVHVLIRFGRWEDILALELPADPELFCTTTALIHYAQGVAYAATGRLQDADAARQAFQAAVARVPDSRYLFNNTSQDILAVAGAMLDGEIEYRRDNFDAAFEHLRRAIALDDALPYDEPWGWMQPTRHAYGALLLEQDRVEAAESVYAEDLGYVASIPRSSWHPGNVWSLHGYHECLVRLGKAEPARIVKQQLDLAVARADVPIQSSCFCRMSHHAAAA